jgi:protocatechuate 3,4-dioxygenase beta subunit
MAMSSANDKKDGEKRLMSRRQTLGLLGAAGLALAVGCNDNDDAGSEGATETAGTTSTPGATGTPAATATTSAATAAPAVSCVVTPEVTEGPYFVDERLNRSDIREDPTTGEVVDGVPLTLTLTVSSVANGGCTPLSGAVVDIWHCDALGAYSDVSSGAGQTDTTGQKFLRGYQVTDGNGQVVFQTIYPGWYSGRAIHIHYKVRTDPESDQGLEFTSQLFFDENLNRAVMTTRTPYSQKGTPNVSNATDNIFDSQLLVALAEDGDGYAGSFHVGVA